ncbi:MAG: hypothetical protein L0G96_01475 [Acinetobacter sp.]|nr:hypothetical protein [Acinetobacter sp.]
MAILDHSLPLQVKAPDMMGMLDQGSQLAQFYTQQKADGELNRLYKETNGDLNKMMEIGKTSPLARFVMPQLQAQQAAQQKAALDQQKTLSDIGKTQSEAFKNNQQGGGYGLDNAGKLMASANQALTVAARTGDPMAARLALSNHLKAGTITPELYNQFDEQIKLIGNNPEELKKYAQSIILAQSKDPDKYMFNTADNVLDNQTAVDNNIRTNQTSENNSIRTAETSRYSTDVNAQTAANKLSVEQAKIELEQKKGTVQQFGDGLYMVYPNGSAVPISSPAGQPIVKSTTTAAQQSAKNEENTRIQRVETIIPEIRTLLSKATGSYLGAGADLLANTVGISTEGAKATAQLKTLSGQMVAAMPKMSGPQSDKDVAMYKEMAGNLSDPTIPVETRLAALETIEKLNEKYKVLNSGGIPASIAKPLGAKPNAIDFFK